MAWIHTCCWTDHSNGCPEEDIARGGVPNAREWYLAWRAVRVKRGYEKQAEAEKLNADADRFLQYLREERGRFMREGLGAPC